MILHKEIQRLRPSAHALRAMIWSQPGRAWSLSCDDRSERQEGLGQFLPQHAWSPHEGVRGADQLVFEVGVRKATCLLSRLSSRPGVVAEEHPK